MKDIEGSTLLLAMLIFTLNLKRTQETMMDIGCWYITKSEESSYPVIFKKYIYIYMQYIQNVLQCLTQQLSPSSLISSILQQLTR